MYMYTSISARCDFTVVADAVATRMTVGHQKFLIEKKPTLTLAMLACDGHGIIIGCRAQRPALLFKVANCALVHLIF